MSSLALPALSNQAHCCIQSASLHRGAQKSQFICRIPKIYGFTIICFVHYSFLRFATKDGVAKRCKARFCKENVRCKQSRNNVSHTLLNVASNYKRHLVCPKRQATLFPLETWLVKQTTMHLNLKMWCLLMHYTWSVSFHKMPTLQAYWLLWQLQAMVIQSWQVKIPLEPLKGTKPFGVKSQGKGVKKEPKSFIPELQRKKAQHLCLWLYRFLCVWWWAEKEVGGGVLLSDGGGGTLHMHQ